MPDFDPNAPWLQPAVEHWHKVQEQLKALEAKDDPESSRQWDELVDELICADSNLGPMRKAMAAAAGNAAAQPQPDPEHGDRGKGGVE